MVVSFMEFDTDAMEASEVGRLHNGDILRSTGDDFDEFVEQVRREQEFEYELFELVEPDAEEVAAEEYVGRRQHMVRGRPELSIRDEDSLVQRFEPPYGNYASVRHPREDLDALCSLADDATPTPAPARPTSLSDVSLRFINWGTTDDDTTYVIRIWGDGFGMFDPRSGLDLDGRYVFQLSRAVIDDLVTTCFDAGIFDLGHTYIDEDEAEPRPAMSLGISIGSTETWFYNYTRDPPSAFQTVRDALEDVVLLDRWTSFSERDIASLVTQTDHIAPALSVLGHRTSEFDLPPECHPALIQGVLDALMEPQLTTRQDGLAVLESVLDAVELAEVETLPAIVSRVAPLVDDDARTVRESAVAIINKIAQEQPDVAASSTSSLTECVTEGNRTVSTEACRALAEIATEAPAAVIDAVPAVASVLGDAHKNVEEAALLVLSRVGRDYPEEVRPAVPQLTSYIQAGDFPVAATKALGHVAKEYPAVAKPLIGTYRDWLDDENYRVRNNALASLADLATHYPDDVVEDSQRFIQLLSDDDDYVRYNATSVIAKLAQSHPETVSNAIPPLIERLQDDMEETRLNACWALGRLGARAAEDELETLRDDDPSESVEAAAIAALEMLNRNECPRCGSIGERHEMAVKVVYPEWVEWECPRCERRIKRDLQRGE